MGSKRDGLYLEKKRSIDMGKYTQLNHRDNAKNSAREVIWWVENLKCTHGKFLELRQERLFDTNSWKRLTRYNQEYILGYMDRWLDEIRLKQHDWRVYHPEFGHLSRDDDRSCLDGRWHEVDGDKGASFWKGTNKVWYPNEIAKMYEDKNGTD